MKRLYQSPESRARGYLSRRTALGLLATGTLALGQSRGVYQVERKSTSATAEAITVQVPVGSARSAQMTGASVYCSVEAEVTVERDGTVATTTSVTPAKMNSADATPGAVAFRSSNVGTANRTTARFIVPAGGTVSFDLLEHRLGAGENITIRTAHASGTVIINIQWSEF